MRGVIALVVLLLVSSAAAAGVQVRGVRMWPAPDNTRLVFDLSAPVEHRVFSLSNPERLVIDLKDTRISGGVPKFVFAKSLLRDIRHASRDADGLRVVLDLKGKVRPKSFVLKPNREYGHRLVIDLYPTEQKAAKPAAGKPKVVKSEPAKLRDLVVAIDAGRKIDAIKVLRERTGIGLADAKHLVDRLARERQGQVAAAPTMVEEGGAGGMLRMTLIIAVILGAYFYYLAA